jgi:hypothetical protein
VDVLAHGMPRQWGCEWEAAGGGLEIVVRC